MPESFPFRSRSAVRPDAPTLDFVVGDLVEQSVDVILAPTWDSDVATSRVQLALRRAAGPALVAEYDARVSALPDGRLAPLENLVTRGHQLPCRYVVHVRPLSSDAAGPNAERALESCFRDAFETCRRLGATSVAAPAIGTGSYGYRVGLVARVAVRTALSAQRASRGPSRIRFVLAGPATLEAFLHAASLESAVTKLAASDR